MMERMMVGRSRTELKSKFKREEKIHRSLVEIALQQRVPIMQGNLLPLVQGDAAHSPTRELLTLEGADGEPEGGEGSGTSRGLREPRGGGITALANRAVGGAEHRSKRGDEGGKRKRGRERASKDGGKKGKAGGEGSTSGKGRKRKEVASYGGAMDGESHTREETESSPKKARSDGKEKKGGKERKAPRSSPRLSPKVAPAAGKKASVNAVHWAKKKKGNSSGPPDPSQILISNQ